MGSKEQKIQMILERIERMDSRELAMFEILLNYVIQSEEEKCDEAG